MVGWSACQTSKTRVRGWKFGQNASLSAHMLPGSSWLYLFTTSRERSEKGEKGEATREARGAQQLTCSVPSGRAVRAKCSLDLADLTSDPRTSCNTLKADNLLARALALNAHAFQACLMTLPDDVAAHFHVVERQLPLRGSGPNIVWQFQAKKFKTHIARKRQMSHRAVVQHRTVVG